MQVSKQCVTKVLLMVGMAAAYLPTKAAAFTGCLLPADNIGNCPPLKLNHENANSKLEYD
jgi:hypothetical protein